MKTALVGAGLISRLHAGVIKQLDEAELVAVADPNNHRASELANAFDIPAHYSDTLEMIEQEKPTVAHVLVPPHLHQEVAEEVMRRGVNVLVEKPLALSRGEVKAMYATADKQGVRLCVDHNYLYEDLVRRALSLVTEGAIGTPVSIETCFQYNLSRNPHLSAEDAEFSHWAYRLNGGPLQDMLVHPASLAVKLAGDPEEIRFIRQRRGLLPEGYDDEIRILIRGNQALGFVSVSFHERPDTVTLTIKGTTGTVDVDLFSNTLILRQESSLPRAITRGISGLSLGFQKLKGAFQNAFQVATGQIDKTGGIAPLVKRFHASIREDRSLPVSAENPLQVAELMEAVWPEPCSGTRRVVSTLSESRSAEREEQATVLVTGATGFIGSHLVEQLLADGVHVRAMVRPGSERAGRMRKLDVECFEGDLADESALCRAVEGVDRVYHLGGSTGDDWEEHQVVTIGATETLLQVALEEGVERFVYVSSLSVCGTEGVPQGATITEEVDYTSQPGPYAQAKIEAEQLARKAHGKGLDTTIVRPGIVVGPRGPVLFPHVGYSVADKLFVLLGKGEHRLPLTYVENTADALIRAGRSENAPGSVYHIVDECSVTAADYIHQFVEEAELDARVISIPFAIPYSMAAAYELFAALQVVPRDLVSRQQLQQKRKDVIYPSERIREELGWQPKVPLEEGLRRTFKWCMQN